MKNKIIYGSLIAIMAIMISVSMYQAEAKTFDKSAGFNVKGVGVSVFSPTVNEENLTVQFYPLNDNTGQYWIYYTSNHNGIFSGGICTGSIQFKDSSIKKIDASFNTAALNCPTHVGPDGDITVTMTGDGKSKTYDKYDTIDCYPYGEGEICTRSNGSLTEFAGIGTSNGFGLSFENEVGTIKDVKLHYTQWTSP